MDRAQNPDSVLLGHGCCVPPALCCQKKKAKVSHSVQPLRNQVRAFGILKALSPSIFVLPLEGGSLALCSLLLKCGNSMSLELVKNLRWELAQGLPRSHPERRVRETFFLWAA
jgi:hypothetical protein